MSEPEQIRKRQSYHFYKGELDKLTRLGIAPDKAVEILKIIHSAVDAHHGYRYAWLADKASESISQIEKEVGL